MRHGLCHDLSLPDREQCGQTGNNVVRQGTMWSDREQCGRKFEVKDFTTSRDIC